MILSLTNKIKSFLLNEKQFFHQTSNVVKALIIFRLLITATAFVITGLSLILFGVLGGDAKWWEEINYFIFLLSFAGYIGLMLIPQRHIVTSKFLLFGFIILNVMVMVVPLIGTAIVYQLYEIPSESMAKSPEPELEFNLLFIFNYLFFGLLPSLFLITSKILLKKRN